MGTPEFAVPILQALARRHRVAAVVTQPDKPQGRGNKLQPPAVKAAAQALGLEVLQPSALRGQGVYEALAGFPVDLYVVAAYGQLLPGPVLALPRLGCLNVHASLLPRYRGASPIAQAVLDGETQTGVTLMAMDQGLDTGPILLQRPLAIAPEDTAGTLSVKLSALGAEALLEALAFLEAGRLTPQPQDPALATYAPLLHKAAGRIDWRETASQITNKIRGMNPWPGAYTNHHADLLKIWGAEGVAGGGDLPPPGTVHRTGPKGPVVATGDGALCLTEVQGPGGKKMPGAAYARGHGLVPGVVFS
jgi:methionyl-tRNA formyltransferase